MAEGGGRRGGDRDTPLVPRDPSWQPQQGGEEECIELSPEETARQAHRKSQSHTHQTTRRKEGNQIKEEKTNLYLCLAAMQRMWSSNVKVADRRGCREEEAEEEEEVVAPAAEEEAPWGLCTVTCRQRESSLSVTTWRKTLHNVQKAEKI